MLPTSQHVAAAVLAGGAGERVGGRDKGLLVLDGEPLIAHVARALRLQVDSVIVCANRHHDEYAAFGQVVADREAGYRGPLAGVAAALQRCERAWLLTVPVDAPRPPHDLLQRLAAPLVASAATATVAHDGTRRQPLFALYAQACADSAAAALRCGHSVQHWQTTIAAVEVDFSDRATAFANLNTLDALAAWERQHGR